MEQEEIGTRIGNLEAQMGQMAAMMTEMKAMMTVAHVRPAAPINLNQTAHSNTPTASDVSGSSGADPITNVDQVPNAEAPPRVAPVVVGSEEEQKEKPVARFEEGVKRIAKIEECLTSQGYELSRFDRVTPFAKIEVPADYKEPEFSRKYNGTGCPKTHLGWVWFSISNGLW